MQRAGGSTFESLKAVYYTVSGRGMQEVSRDSHEAGRDQIHLVLFNGTFAKKKEEMA